MAEIQHRPTAECDRAHSHLMADCELAPVVTLRGGPQHAGTLPEPAGVAPVFRPDRVTGGFSGELVQVSFWALGRVVGTVLLTRALARDVVLAALGQPE